MPFSKRVIYVQELAYIMIERDLEYASFLEQLWFHGEIEKENEEPGKLVIEIETDDDKENRYYYYEEVDGEDVRGLIDAYKQGSYFNNEIKGRYDYEELTDDSELIANIV